MSIEVFEVCDRCDRRVCHLEVIPSGIPDIAVLTTENWKRGWRHLQMPDGAWGTVCPECHQAILAIDRSRKAAKKGK